RPEYAVPSVAAAYRRPVPNPPVLHWARPRLARCLPSERNERRRVEVQRYRVRVETGLNARTGPVEIGARRRRSDQEEPARAPSGTGPSSSQMAVSRGESD